MSYRQCNKCKEFGIWQSHKCPPAWNAVCINAGDDPENPERTAYGATAEDAALWLAEEKFHDWDCPSTMEIWVRLSGTPDWHKFQISVEAVPSFSAEEVTK